MLAQSVTETNNSLTDKYPISLLGERSEPHTGVFNRDFAWYVGRYMYVCMSVVVQKA